MPIQTATTGQLDEAQGTIIAAARYTAEHNAPVAALYEKFVLPQGNKVITVPKVGQVTFADLQDGVDMTDTEDIGMTTVDLTTDEIGAKFILTDKLVRQEAESVFTMIGRQLGDGYARKTDRDAIALFSTFSNTLGADGKNLNMLNLTACIAFAKANKFPAPISIVHHPNAIYDVMKAVAVVASTASGGTGTVTPTVGPMAGSDASRDRALANFYKFTFNQVNVYEDGNIDKVTSYDSGYGAIFSRSACAYTVQLGFSSARERDESLRATEIVVVGDQSLTELDDGYGGRMHYEIGNPATNN